MPKTRATLKKQDPNLFKWFEVKTEKDPFTKKKFKKELPCAGSTSAAMRDPRNLL